MADKDPLDAISCWVKHLSFLCPDMLGKFLKHRIVVQRVITSYMSNLEQSGLCHCLEVIQCLTLCPIPARETILNSA